MDEIIKRVRAALELKAAGEPGAVQAVFSTFNVVDHDQDIVLASAFAEGQAVPMTWSHRWDMPIGKGVIRVRERDALFDGAFFLETDAGAEAYKTVKAMGPLQEWSWGFRVLDAAYEQRDTEYVRLIKRAEVFEVSPVLVGSGIGTYTETIKGLSLHEEGEAALAAVSSLRDRCKSLADLRAKEGRVLSEANRKRLGSLLEALRAVETDIDNLLTSTERDDGKDADLQRLMLEYERTRAQIACLGL